MSSSLKNVTLIGASGNVGSAFLNSLIASGKFNIKVLKRASSSATFPGGVEVADVDFASFESLKSAFAGQDAVISALGMTGLESQILIADAAASAGVKRFLPSEYGADLANDKIRQLPIFAPKAKVADHLVDLASKGALSYTFVRNNVFLDWCIDHDILLPMSNSQVLIYNGGDLPFSATTLPSVGDAVVGVLSHPEETKNRSVYVHEIVITQNQLLALARQAVPNRKFETLAVDLDEAVAQGGAKLARGEFSMEAVLPFLVRATLEPGYGGKYEKTDNKLLGIGSKTEQDIVEMFRKHFDTSSQ